MTSTDDDRQADIVRLTKAAVQAAQLGRWDVVAQCYSERGVLLETVRAPVHEADALLRLDEQIRDQVNTVQAVLVSLLNEAMTTRQRLQSARQRFGALSPASETLSVEA